MQFSARNKIPVDKVRNIVPYNLFKRLDLRKPREKYEAIYHLDFGGNYLLRRICFRWGLGGTPETPEATSAYIPHVTQYYVDLSAAGTGHAGTVGDPFSFADWQTYLSIQAADTTFWIKGTYINTGGIAWSIGGFQCHYRAWDPINNGPWRLQTSLDIGYAAQPYITGGILYFWNGSNLGDHNCSNPICYQNMHIIARDFTWNTSYVSGLITERCGGCTVDVENMIFNGGFGIEDSLIRAFNASGGGGQLFNCMYDFTTNTALGMSYVNCYAGNIPYLPDFYGTESQFNISNFDFVPFPPNPGYGSPPNYLYYEGGMYGYQRSATGAISFYNPPPSLPTEIYATVRKMTSTFKYFELHPPVLLSSPCNNNNCELIVQSSPVDFDIFSRSFKKSQRLALKTFNWILEPDATLIIEITKEVTATKVPEVVDIVVEGYYNGVE